MNVLLGSPTEIQADRIRKELGEDADRLQNNVKLFETWVSYQKHLPQNYDRTLLTTFLRGCKHDMECAKRKFEYHFICKAMAPDLFGNRVLTNDGDLKVLQSIIVAPLPELTAEGYRLSLFKLTNTDISSFLPLESERFTFIMTDYRLYNETLCAGEVLIIDTENLTAQHVAKCFTHRLRHVLDFLQNGYPFRIRQVHFLTNQLYIEKFINVLKQFVKEKIQKRFYMHHSIESLEKYVSLNLLPSDYGGGKMSVKDLAEELRRTLTEKSEWCKGLENVRINGPIPKNVSVSYSVDDFGTEGSFRELNID